MEERDNRVLLKLRTLRKTASPSRPPVDIAKEKSKEKKIDMVHVLKIMSAEGDKGILLKAIADRLKISSHKVQEALQQLTNKKLIEEVVGVSGTKYYLTELGKNYCMKKGIIKSDR
jgi:predicted transcriptional regulator